MTLPAHLGLQVLHLSSSIVVEIKSETSNLLTTGLKLSNSKENPQSTRYIASVQRRSYSEITENDSLHVCFFENRKSVTTHSQWKIVQECTNNTQCSPKKVLWRFYTKLLPVVSTHGKQMLAGAMSLAKPSSYAPNFEEVEEAYWFGPVCVCVVRYALHTAKNG